MTRLFVAAWPPEHIRARLSDLTAIAPQDGERRAADANWHVTLRYIGNVDIDRVTERLDAADIPTARAVIGPEVTDLGGRQIVVPVTGVDLLAHAVRQATADLGEVDNRPFFGHVTLARLRDGAGSTLRGASIDGVFEITEVALVSSDTLPTGAVYETIATFPTTRSPHGTRTDF